MILRLNYYPEELLAYLTGPKYDESRIFPEIEVPDEILEDIPPVIDEFMNCRWLVKGLNTKKYSIKFPFDPNTYYTKMEDILNPHSFPWYEHWLNWPNDKIFKERTAVIKFFEQNKIISVESYSDKKNPYYHILIEENPNFEALTCIQSAIGQILDWVEMDEREQKIESKKSYIVRAIEKQAREAELKRSRIIYQVDFKMSGEIVLNNKYIIAKPHFDTENDKVFEYISKKSKQKVTIEEIEKEVGKVENDLSKIIYNLGFKGELKKLFFPRIGNKSIIFNNNIMQEDLDSLNINIPVLEQQIKQLQVR